VVYLHLDGPEVFLVAFDPDRREFSTVCARSNGRYRLLARPLSQLDVQRGDRFGRIRPSYGQPVQDEV
jgi:hypothetical protein